MIKLKKLIDKVLVLNVTYSNDIVSEIESEYNKQRNYEPE